MGKYLIIAATLLLTLSCEAQTLNINCEENAQYRGPDGKMTGLDIEIVSELQKRIGNTDQIQLVPWTRGLKYLDTVPNTLLFSMARTKERNNLYQWIGPISEAVYGFYAKSGTSVVINSLDDARKAGPIGVYRNDVRDKFLTDLGFNNLDRTSNNESNLKKLMAGRVNMIASSAFGIRVEARMAGYNMNEVKFLYAFLKLPVFIAASKQMDPKIVASWNVAIESMKKDGSLVAIFRKYLPEQDDAFLNSMLN